MKEHDIIEGGVYTGERAMFASQSLNIRGGEFRDGESPLKHSRMIRLQDCSFGWKYPLWYCSDVDAEGVVFRETARSGVWYTSRLTMNKCRIEAPKTFRRCTDLTLRDVSLPLAAETLWYCEGVTLRDVTVCGDYFGMSSSDVYAEGLDVVGNYIFDGGRNIEIHNSHLMSKDAFWNCENVTVYDSVIVGEYLGWNSKNVRLVNCDIESNQGLCFIDGLVLENCRLNATDLAFEYSTVQADITTHVDSIKNPSGGRISAPSCGEIIMEPSCVDVTKTEIVIGGRTLEF